MTPRENGQEAVPQHQAGKIQEALDMLDDLGIAGFVTRYDASPSVDSELVGVIYGVNRVFCDVMAGEEASQTPG